MSEIKNVRVSFTAGGYMNESMREIELPFMPVFRSGESIFLWCDNGDYYSGRVDRVAHSIDKDGYGLTVFVRGD